VRIGLTLAWGVGLNKNTSGYSNHSINSRLLFDLFGPRPMLHCINVRT